jgi:protein phosphatase
LTRWRYAAATDTGLVRQNNQDAIYVDDHLAIVADGMGGHAAGDVAATMTIDVVRGEFGARANVEGLFRAIERANQDVLADASTNPEHFGMGTTVIAIGLTEDAQGVVSPTLVHVGDSRAYQLRDGALRRLSDDHSVAEEWVRMGRLTPEEAAVHPRRHQLTRGVGVESTIAVDVMSLEARPGDRVLLCSDGLSNELDDDTLARLASAPSGLDEAVESLIAAARAAGGRDNISAVLVEFDEVNQAAVPVKRTISSSPAPVAAAATTRPRARRRARLTWRVWAAALVFVGVGIGFVAIVHWYAYSTYYLADDAGTIAVYQGQPSGVLWYHPRFLLDTNFSVSQLTPADAASLRSMASEPSVAVALNVAATWHQRWVSGHPQTTTTPTTTPTTTTIAKG